MRVKFFLLIPDDGKSIHKYPRPDTHPSIGAFGAGEAALPDAVIYTRLKIADGDDENNNGDAFSPI